MRRAERFSKLVEASSSAKEVRILGAGGFEREGAMPRMKKFSGTFDISKRMDVKSASSHNRLSTATTSAKMKKR